MKLQQFYERAKRARLIHNFVSKITVILIANGANESFQPSELCMETGHYKCFHGLWTEGDIPTYLLSFSPLEIVVFEVKGFESDLKNKLDFQSST